MVPYGLTSRMLGTLIDHVTFLPRLARDRWLEKTARYPFRGDEYPTRYLSQASVALSCDAYGGVPYVMYGIEGRAELVSWDTYRHVRDGGAVWLRIEDLQAFNQRVLPHVKGQLVLVTSESDYTVPSDFPDAAKAIARSGKIVRWLSTNYDNSAYQDLITGFPQGLNHAKKNDLHFYGRMARMGVTRVDMKPPRVQEAEWAAIVAAAPPVKERIRKAVADFHLNDTATDRRYGESREDIRRQLSDNPLIAWLRRRGHLRWLFSEYSKYAFVVSPHGHGLDCYRTWEALFAGCIPIVKSSPIDYLYRDLPVAIVRDWREITASKLDGWVERFGTGFDRAPVERTLSVVHWVSRLHESG